MNVQKEGRTEQNTISVNILKHQWGQAQIKEKANKTKIHQTIIKDLDFSLSTHPNSDIDNCNSDRLYMMWNFIHYKLIRERWREENCMEEELRSHTVIKWSKDSSVLGSGLM